MKLKLVRTMWGILDATKPEPDTWEKVFQKITEEGFEAIEGCVGPFNAFGSNKKLFDELRAKYKLDFIAQVHTCGYPITSAKVEDHVRSFHDLVKEAKAWGATFVNAHSGYDGWSMEENIRFYQECVRIEKEEGITCTHETHRRRVFYNPWVTRDVIKAVPELKINADLSHFAVVGERLYDWPCDEDRWPQALALIANNCHLIHARVGYDEGPQVPDPSAPEYQDALLAHERWWSTIWASMADRKFDVVYMEPEHGPAPYLHTLPHTNVPVADLWKVNTWVGHRQAKRFYSLYGTN